MQPLLATLAACLIAVAFGYLGSMPLTGPIAVIEISRAARGHYSEALRIGIGAAIAEAMYAGVAFWGYTTVLARHPLLLPVSHVVTAVVLAVLGIRFSVWKPAKQGDERERKAGTVLLGFTVSAVNPTLLVTWGAAVAFLYSKGLSRMPAFAAVPFGVCAGAGVAGWCATLVAILRKYEGKLPRRALTWTVRLLGVALVGLAFWSGVQLASWLHRSDADHHSRARHGLRDPELQRRAHFVGIEERSEQPIPDAEQAPEIPVLMSRVRAVVDVMNARGHDDRFDPRRFEVQIGMHPVVQDDAEEYVPTHDERGDVQREEDQEIHGIDHSLE